MEIQSGFYYHIKDTFFAEVQDNSLRSNKEDGNYRPHYLAIRDSHKPKIYWMIPVSSNLRLHKRGIPLFYTDIDRIYKLMEAKL